MRKYEMTAKGKFTVTLLSFAALVCVVALISTRLPKNSLGSPSSTPDAMLNVNGPTPSNASSSPSSKPSGARPSGREESPPSLQPIPVTTPPPQATPSPTLSWGTKSLVLAFSNDSSELNGEMASSISQFMGNSPDLAGWIMVVEGHTKHGESPDTLRMDRANAVSSYIIDKFDLAADMILPIKGQENAEDAYVEIYFIGSGSK